jgi:nucleoside-diphosphate-sugar epimerase
MRAFVTGGTGFIGRSLVEQLRERGDEVVALVRDPDRARELEAQLVEGDLSDPALLEEHLRGCDAVFHLAGMYEVGIPARDRARMYDANVRGTEHVLDAAVAAGVPRIVHVSTINAFGNTHGEVVDETYERPGGDFVSYYDETKYLAHRAAEERIADGAPVVIAQPGAVYGPGDHSDLGSQLEQARAGKLRMLALADVGVNAVHVDDVAGGLIRVHDHGKLGEAYVLGGQITTLRDLIEIVSRQARHAPPRIELPTWAVKLAIPFGPLVGRVMGTGPNLRELISAADGVTYWASDAKARRDLGYAPRKLEDGLATLATAGARARL